MKGEQLASRRRVYLPEDLVLRPANRDDHAFLYQLLVERYEKPAVNIPGMARASLPSFAEHVAYLDRKPYARLEIVEVDGVPAGMMYLSHQSVGGCFVLNRYSLRGLGLAACYRFFLNGPYPVIAHFSTRNRAGWRTAERLGFVRTEELPHRLSFELRAAPLDPFCELRLSSAGAPQAGVRTRG